MSLPFQPNAFFAGRTALPYLMLTLTFASFRLQPGHVYLASSYKATRHGQVDHPVQQSLPLRSCIKNLHLSASQLSLTARELQTE
jgi:hypothetical protein